MYTREQIEQHIWDYIDGLSTPAEKIMVEKLLQTDPLWQKVYGELDALNGMIQATDIMEEPPMRFTRNVMEEVSKYKVAPPAQSYINKKIIYGILAFFLVTMVGLLGYLFTTVDLSSSTAPVVDTPKFEFNISDYLNSTVLNIFMFMNVIAGLLLLDHQLRKRRSKEAY